MDVVAYIFFLLLMVGAIVQIAKDFKSGRTLVLDGEILVGSGGTAGFQAAVLPMLSAMTFVTMGIIIDELTSAKSLHVIALIAYWACGACLVLGGSLFLFMRPRFLVIPVLRGSPGFIVGTYRRLRSRRN